MPRSRQIQQRARYARTDLPGALRVNNPAGFPSSYEPIGWWWGSDQFLRPVSPSTGLAAITRATSLICNTIASLPWRLVTGGPTPATSVIDIPPPRWLLDPQLRRPDDRIGGQSPIPSALRNPRSLFWASWIRSSLWYGTGYLIYEVANDGSPTAGTLRVLNPEMVSNQVNPDGDIVRRITEPSGNLWIDTDWDGGFQLGPRRYQLVELSNPLTQPDEYGQTQGVLAAHAMELQMAAQSVHYGQGMFRSGVPAGILKSALPNLKREQAELLRSQWLESHGGDTRSVGVLNATTEFIPLQMSPVDMALIQTRQMSLLDIANAFGVPAYMLGNDTSGSNSYSNTESRSLDFKQYSLFAWSTALEEELTALLPTGTFVLIDYRGLSRPDTKTRYEAYQLGLQGGWFTIDEVRQLENLPPLTPGTEVTPA